MPFEEMEGNVNETQKKLKDIWNGMVYHCHELTQFMVEHGEDPYFDTAEGKEMKRNVLDLTLAHVSGMLKLQIF